MLPPFFTPAPGFPEAKAIIASFHEALRQAPPTRLVVLLSSIGSQQTSGLGMITATCLSGRLCRAGSFLENYTSGLKSAASTGWFDTYLTPTNRAVPMVATEDIGKEIAHLLIVDFMQDRKGAPRGKKGVGGDKKVVELGSPISPDSLARAMSEVLGRPVRARSIPREQWTASLEAQGLPPGFIGPFLEMEGGFNSGWIDFGVPGTEPVAGTATPAQVFE
jgi:hypothetical protein